MMVCIRFTGTASAVEVNGYAGLIYFIIFLYLSSYQLFRLFVAIIAQSFELDDDEKLDAQVGCFKLWDDYKIRYSKSIFKQTLTSWVIQEKLLDAEFKEEKVIFLDFTMLTWLLTRIYQVKVANKDKVTFWDEKEEYADFSFNTHFRDLVSYPHHASRFSCWILESSCFINKKYSSVKNGI
jgi:hypothetical protein